MSDKTTDTVTKPQGDSHATGGAEPKTATTQGDSHATGTPDGDSHATGEGV
ncbi:hypothetical protein [Streptomyces sp. NPDC093109]|uniref:hypothetical protein n=1 Tax=Streptomyces sp. NPDC093109 TaxID=3154977 RepID=UPI00344CDCCB